MDNQNIENIDVTFSDGNTIISITPPVQETTITDADYLAQLQARRADVANDIANAQAVIDTNNAILVTIDAKIAAVPAQ